MPLTNQSSSVNPACHQSPSTSPKGTLHAFVASVVDEGVAARGVHADARHVAVSREMSDHFLPVDGHVHLSPPIEYTEAKMNRNTHNIQES